MGLHKPWKPKRPTLYIRGVSDHHEEEEGEEVHEDLICRECAGSGIGKYGDPERSRCIACRGTGMEQTE